MSAAIWRAVPAFAAGDSLALDLPGHGAAVWDEALGADISLWARDVLARAPQRAIWLGWSLGGLVALEAARLAPERVAGLGLLACNPCFVARDDWPCAMDAATFTAFAAEVEQDHAQTLRRFLALQSLGAADARAVRALLFQLADEAAGVDVRALRAGLAMLRSVDQRAALSALTMPVAWLHGERDKLVPWCAQQACYALQPAARVATVRGAGHAPFLYGDEANDELGAMLAWLMQQR